MNVATDPTGEGKCRHLIEIKSQNIDFNARLNFLRTMTAASLLLVFHFRHGMVIVVVDVGEPHKLNS